MPSRQTRRRQRQEQSEQTQQRRQQWERRVVRARRVREAWEQRYQVETLERYYLGFHTPWLAYQEPLDTYLNHFYATVQAQRPALVPNTVEFLVSPRPGQRALDDVLVRGMAGVLNAVAGQDHHLMQALRLAATQAFFRAGVLKVSYDPRMEPNPRKGLPLLSDLGTPALDGRGESLTEPDELLTDEVYCWQWVNASHMLLPDEGPDRSRWSWIGEEIEVPLAEAREDTRFPQPLRDQLVANGRLQQDKGYTQDADPLDQDNEIFRYIECWDLRKNRLLVFAEGQPFTDFLINDDTPEGVEDHPYALLLPVPILGPDPCPWPKPLTFDWLPIQRDYNLLRLQQINAGKRAARKILYEQSTFPDVDEAQKALESSVDMQGVQVTDITRPPTIMPDGSLSTDVARNIPYLLADWQRVTGASGTRLGDPDSGTATEAVISEQNAAVRDNELRTMIHEWLGEAGSKMLQLIRQTLTLDIWVQMREWNNAQIQQFLASPGFEAYLATRVGPGQVSQWIQMIQTMPGMQEMLRQKFAQLKPMRVTRSQLQFEADVQVLPSTVRPLHRAQLLQLVSLLGPMAMMSPTLLEELLASFELPQGEQIAEEILAAVQQQQAAGMGMPPRGPQVPGTPTPGGSPGNPLGTQNPLGAVSATGGL
jgi:hypothetical protein